MVRSSLTDFAARSLTRLVLVIAVVGVGFSQDTAKGLQLWSTSEFGIDLASSNLHIPIPIRSQRVGPLAMSASLNIDSHAFNYADSGTHKAYTDAIPQFGLSVGSNLLTASAWTVTPGSCYVGGTPYSGIWAAGVIDGSGVYHGFGGYVYVYPLVCTSSPHSGQATTTDGSGLTLKIVADTSGTGWDYYIWDAAGNESAYTSISTSRIVTTPYNVSISMSRSGATQTYVGPLTSTPLLTFSGTTYAYTDANGNAQQYAISSTPFTVQTNFGCGTFPYSFYKDFGPVSNYPLATAITLPGTNGAYTITYEATPGYPGSVTGRIASITYPSGGSVSYAYSGGNGNANGYDCISQVVPTITVTTNDSNGNVGVWTYVNTKIGNPNNGSYPTNYTVTRTSPATPLSPNGDQTVYSFNSRFRTQTKVYQGASSGTPVLTTITCYNGNVANCSAPSNFVALPITEIDTYTTPNNSSSSARVKVTFDGYGNVTSVAKYDFGASVYTTQASTTYGSWNGSTCVAVGSGISNLPCDARTTDSAAHTLSESRFTYNSLGGMTTSSVWAGSSWLTTTFVPNPNGTIASSSGPNGLSTTYGYAATGSGGCNGLLETSRSTTVASGDVLTPSTTWNCDGPVILSTTDAGGNGTSYLYNDALFRRTSFTDESGYQTTTSYTATSVTSSASFGSSVASTTASTDGLGRVVLSQKQQAPGSSNYDTVSYRFNSTNWQTGTSTPCTQPLGSGCTSYFAVSTFDALGRTLQTVDASGNGTVANTYSMNDTGVTLAPTPSGESTKSVHTEFDGLGRIKSKCSILSTGGSSCGQGMSGFGILSTFAYTLATGSTAVAVTRGSQTHTTVSDALGRVTSTATPEAGTTQNVYDTQTATCGSSSYKGDLVETIDNAGVHICYSYDVTHRLLSVRPASGTNCKGFIYGDNSYTAPTGVTVSNGRGRMVAAYTNSSCDGRSSLVTDEWFSYDKNGRMTDMWEMTPHSGGYYHAAVSYFPNGVVNSLSGIPGYTAYTFGVDGEGRANTAVQGSTSIVSGVTFNASSQPLVVSIGTVGDNDTYTYDPATGRMGTYAFSVNGQTDVGTLTWNPNGTLRQLAIVDGFNAGGTQICTFGYDDIMRLVSDNCGSTHWSQIFSYDQYGNLTKTGNPGITWNPGYSSTNNRYSMIGATYDSDGRLTYDSFNTYTWDAYGKMSSVSSGTGTAVCGTSGTCVTYDASGRAVEKNVSGTYSEILNSPMGETAIMSGASTVAQSYIPLPGGMSMIATGAGGTGQLQMEHHDWLGTTRLSTALGSRAVVYDRAFAPYGENYDNFGSTSSLNFTGDRQDIVAGLFDTPTREQMPNQGRWISPDPAGQGWNLYAYPTNPNRSVDPSGLYSYSLGDLHGCVSSMGMGSCLNGSLGEGWVDNWSDALGQKLQQYAQLNQDPIQQMMDRINGVVTGVFRQAFQALNWGLSHWDLFQPFVDSGMADTSVRVGWFKNTVLNPFGHIALGVGDNPLMGLNPASDAQFIAYLALYADGCVGGLACNPLAMTVVPGVILPEDPSNVPVKEMTYFISAERGILIETGIGLSKDNPPNYSVEGRLPACDCGSWAQQMLGFGGIASGPPTWKPETLMQQLEQF